MSTVRLEAVKTPAQREIPMQPASQDIWDKKYRLKTKHGAPVDADIDGTYQRVARALSEAEATPEKQKYWNERFLWALRRGAIPAGRITSNAGALAHKPATSTINCTVSGTIEDSMDGILDKVHEAGLTLKAGCGIGYEFSTLRPRGAFVAGAGAYTSGPMSFMDIYDKMCFTVSSAGGRRGAQMGTFDVSHPDVKDFIRAVTWRGPDRDQFNYFSLDLKKDEKARVKVYLRHCDVSALELEKTFSAARFHQSGDVSQFLEAVGQSTGLFTSKPLCSCFSFVAGSERPLTATLHFPVNHYSDDLPGTTARFRHFLERHELDAGAYERCLSSFLGGPELAVEVQHYLSYRHEADDIRTTAYLSPVLFQAASVKESRSATRCRSGLRTSSFSAPTC